MELNLDGHGQSEPVKESTEVAKSSRFSVLDRLNTLKENPAHSAKKERSEPER
jgi:hypothetical protein